MNNMVAKRDALESLVKNLVGNEFRSSTRLRRATFDSSTRAERIRVMGDPTAYFEVIWTGATGQGVQVDSLDTEVLQGHQFRFNLWMEYKDAESYQGSSQQKFDALCEGENGILTKLRDTPVLQADEMYMIYHPTEVVVSEVSLDNEGRDLAHYLTFIISIR